MDEKIGVCDSSTSRSAQEFCLSNSAAPCRENRLTISEVELTNRETAAFELSHAPIFSSILRLLTPEF